MAKTTVAQTQTPLRLQAAKAREREAIATLRETELARKREELIDKKMVGFLVEDTIVKLRQGLMRAPAQAITDLRRFHFPHEQLHAIRMSLDKTFRAELGMAEDALKKVAHARATYAEIVGDREPSQKAVVAAARRRARVNAKRRVRRKVAARADRDRRVDRDLGAGSQAGSRPARRWLRTTTCRGGARLVDFFALTPNRALRTRQDRPPDVFLRRPLCLLAADLLLSDLNRARAAPCRSRHNRKKNRK